MKKFIFIFLIGMLTIFVSQRAFAYGIGAYATGGGGMNFGWGNEIIKSYPITNLGGGFVYDSNPMGKGSIYRLNVGVQQWKDTVSNSTADLDYTQSVIGKIVSSGGSSSYFDGKIDDIRIYSDALTADEVLALYYE